MEGEKEEYLLWLQGGYVDELNKQMNDTHTEFWLR